MRTFYVEWTFPENWGRRSWTKKIRAHTLNGVFIKIRKKIPHRADVYQILTRIKGCKLEQPVWDYWNGNYSKYYGLNL